MSAEAVAERFRRRIEVTSARPASRLVVRFALYTGIDWSIEDAETQPPTVRRMPVWVAVAYGLLITPAARRRPSRPTLSTVRRSLATE